jgi:DNA-binding HxlR family transcriptional regulator
MPKKVTPYITQFFNRDKMAFNALSKVGHATPSQLKSCGVADSRIKNYVRDGLVEKVAYKSGKDTGEAYKLTKAGREMASNNWGIKNHYHAQSVKHDLDIANKFFSLSDSQRDTWKTETELRDRFEERIQEIRDQGDEDTAKMYEDMLNQGLISMPDASYETEDGVEICYEVITNNYGEAELQAKEAYVQIVKCEYETSRV